MKQTMKALCSTLLTISMLPISAHAAEDQSSMLDWTFYSSEGITENADGQAETQAVFRLGTFVIVTDQTGIDAAELQKELHYKNLQELQPESLVAFSIEFGGDSGHRYYLVDIPGLETYTINGSKYIRDNPIATNGVYSPELRKLIVGHNNILDAIEVSFHATSIVDWNGDFTASLMGQDEPLDSAVLTGYQEAVSDLNAVKDSLSGYVLLEKAKEKAADLTEINQDVCYMVTADTKVVPDMSSANYQVFSAIESIGDVNLDGHADASDAALILMDSAVYGATSSHSLSNNEVAVADVNADGDVNAVDAAIVLQYSARVGAGESAQMVDML